MRGLRRDAQKRGTTRGRTIVNLKSGSRRSNDAIWLILGRGRRGRRCGIAGGAVVGRIGVTGANGPHDDEDAGGRDREETAGEVA